MEFQSLLQGVYRGDQGAATALYREYGTMILRVVRRHLHASARTRADSEDFVQEVWLAFVKDAPRERSFGTPAELAAFLAQIARNKVIDAVRRCLVLQYANVAREQAIEASPKLSGRLAGCLSTPSERAMRNELQERILSELLPAQRRIGSLIFAGKPLPLIAEETETSLRTVERVRKRILDRLE
jgi:RNA polymerase sigma factor (sigma-70 family)